LNKNRVLGIFLILILLISFASTNFIGPNTSRKVIIDGDGSGLYAYLPALLIYKTIDFTPVFEFEKSRRSPDYTGHYFHDHDGILINKFSSGTALLQLPMFLLAYFLSYLFGLEADGYNILFQYAVAVSALIWVFIGLVFFIKLCKLYKIKKETAWLLAISGFLGSNLFYYTLSAPAASHVYSFGLISMFLYYMKKNFLLYKKHTLFISTVLLALIVLVRPVNILITLSLPFLAGSLENFTKSIKEKLKTGDIIIVILIFIIGISPQLIINYLQTGRLVFYGYENEGFYFGNPEIINFLFSYRKGWFVYTPIMLLLLPAFVSLYKRSKFELFSFTAFLLLLIYFFSSWWNWFYGDSFGMRPMVEYYGLFFLIIAIFISNFKRIWQLSIVLIFISLTLTLNLIQSIQYTKGIIHPDSMNKEAYWKIFLKTSDAYAGIIAASDESFHGQLEKEPFFETMNDMESLHFGWTDPEKSERSSYSGSRAIQMNESRIYSPSFTYKIPLKLQHAKNLYVIFNVMIRQDAINSAQNALFIVDISNKEGKTLFYKKFKVKKLPDDMIGQWKKESIGFKLPEISKDMASIKFYIWNVSKGSFMVDDLGIQMYKYN
jgi:hypothetical protein